MQRQQQREAQRSDSQLPPAAQRAREQRGGSDNRTANGVHDSPHQQSLRRTISDVVAGCIAE